MELHLERLGAPWKVWAESWTAIQMDFYEKLEVVARSVSSQLHGSRFNPDLWLLCSHHVHAGFQRVLQFFLPPSKNTPVGWLLKVLVGWIGYYCYSGQLNVFQLISFTCLGSMSKQQEFGMCPSTCLKTRQVISLWGWEMEQERNWVSV